MPINREYRRSWVRMMLVLAHLCVGGATMLTATRQPGSPAMLLVERGNGDSVRVGESITLLVRVVDRDANEIPGVPVTFTVTAGGGTVADLRERRFAPSATNISSVVGVTGTSWILGPSTSQQTVTATVSHLSVVVFTAVGKNGWIVITSTGEFNTLRVSPPVEEERHGGSGWTAVTTDGWTVLTGPESKSVVRRAQEGSRGMKGPPWSATSLLTPPALHVSCHVPSQQLSVFLSNPQLPSGKSMTAVWILDDGPAQSATWIPGDGVLLHPGSQTATRQFLSDLSRSQTILITIDDPQFEGADIFPVFGLRGLAQVLPHVTAACP